MKIFGQIVKTVINTTLLPVEIVKDVVTLGNYGEGSYTAKRIKILKEEAEE